MSAPVGQPEDARGLLVDRPTGSRRAWRLLACGTAVVLLVAGLSACGQPGCTDIQVSADPVKATRAAPERLVIRATVQRDGEPARDVVVLFSTLRGDAEGPLGSGTTDEDGVVELRYGPQYAAGSPLVSGFADADHFEARVRPEDQGTPQLRELCRSAARAVLDVE